MQNCLIANNHRMTMSRDKGFSLLEILVAIALVSILSLFLISLVRGTSSGAYSIQCMANLRAHVGAAKQWSVENSDKFPSDRMRTELSSYLGVKDASVKQDTVMSCPAVQASQFPTRGNMHATYGMNQYLTSSFGKDGVYGQVFSWQKVRFYHKIDRPERVFYFMDGQWSGSADSRGYRLYRAMFRIGDDMEFIFPHRDGINVVHVDGGVRWISREEMFREENQAINLPDNPWGVPYPYN